MCAEGRQICLRLGREREREREGERRECLSGCLFTCLSVVMPLVISCSYEGRKWPSHRKHHQNMLLRLTGALSPSPHPFTSHTFCKIAHVLSHVFVIGVAWMDG
mmetsp:Transcript_25114/g.62165  ORF Transcript_25114/g.62165 Transcript_25114/m.62165 type:complete len:104 (+) Transcript_25114:659-970(+)